MVALDDTVHSNEVFAAGFVVVGAGAGWAWFSLGLTLHLSTL